MGQAKQRRESGDLLDRDESLEWDFTSFIGANGHVDYSRIPVDVDEDPVGYAAWVSILLALVHVDVGGPDASEQRVTGVVVASRSEAMRLALHYVKDCYRASERRVEMLKCA